MVEYALSISAILDELVCCITPTSAGIDVFLVYPANRRELLILAGPLDLFYFPHSPSQLTHSYLTHPAAYNSLPERIVKRPESHS
jgi:hypothetical protein